MHGNQYCILCSQREKVRTYQGSCNSDFKQFQRMVNVSVDRGLIDKLSTLMDPKNDNAYLTVNDFLDVGKQWLVHVKQSHNNQDIENRSHYSSG